MGIQPHHTRAEERGGDVEARQRGRSATIASSINSIPSYHGNSNSRRNLTRAAPNGAPMSPEHGWVDEGRSVEQSARTFYREGTPPPTPGTRDTNLDVSSTTNILNKAGEFYDYQYDHVAPPAPIPRATICGVTTRVFWLVLGIVGLLVAVGVGIGVGIGLGTKGHSPASHPRYVYTSHGLVLMSPFVTIWSPTSNTNSASVQPYDNFPCKVTHVNFDFAYGVCYKTSPI